MKPVVTIDTEHDITSIILNEAAKHGFDPIGFVAGAIGESGLNEQATREEDWPDVSYGLWQPAVAFLDGRVPGLARGVGGVLDTQNNRQIAKAFCFDAERLAAYTAPAYARLLAENGQNSVAAWCRYNAPGLSPEENPNFDNIAAAHERAEQFRDDGDNVATTDATTAGSLPLPDMEFIGCLGENFAEGRGGIKPEAIVLHIAEGSLTGTDATFNEHNPHGQASAHFCVGKDGTIHQYVNTADTAFGNGIVEDGHTARLVDDNEGIDPNAWTISIEHEGHSNEDMPTEDMTAEQFDASTRLTAWLFQNRLFTSGATGVAVDRDHILRHSDITPINKPFCPGFTDAFIDSYIEAVQALLA